MYEEYNPMDGCEQEDQFLCVKLLYTRKLEHERHVRFHLRFTKAVLVILPSYFEENQ
jgi:hypothetical protein